MRYLPLAIVLMGMCQAQAMPLAPVPAGALDGVPLAQAMATMELLGEWPLLSGGKIRLEQVPTTIGGECGVSGLDDADTCSRLALFVSVNGETSEPADFSLFRLPETLGWKVSKKPASGFGAFSISLSACEMKRTAKGFGWKGTSYLLQVKEALVDGHYRFAADLEKLPGERPDCSK